MANLYSIKTTASNSFFGFPQLSLYVNQELYDKYVDKPNQNISSGTMNAPSSKPFARDLKDDALIFLRRKVYYNNYGEKNQQFQNNTDLILQCLHAISHPILKYNGSITQTDLIYNNRTYGELYCFDNAPGAGGSGYRVNSYLKMGGGTHFCGYECTADYSSGNFSYDGGGVQNFRFQVFPESILNEDGEIEIGGKCILISIYAQFNGTYEFEYRVDYVGTVAVNTLVNASMFNNIPVVEETDDPYAPQGSVDQGGGDGTYDGTSDTISEPNLPTLSALDTGFVTVFKPTKTQLKNLYDYLWTGLFDINNFRKIFANPIDTIMGFGIVPINLVTGTAKEVKVGNIGTGINMLPVSEQYYRLDCGTITIPEYWGTYLDYEPYFTMDLYLPYIGSVPISTDDVKRNWVKPKTGTIQVVYHIDILSGACVAYILCNGSVAYEYAGSCLTQLPITGNDFTSTFQSIIGIAGNVTSAGIKIAAGGSAGILNDATDAAHNVMNAKPTINRSGGVASTSGLMGVQTPYLILNRPIPAVAGNQNSYTGYPAHMTKILSEVHGYTEWEQVWFKDIPATDPELQELKTLLDGGVIL